MRKLLVDANHLAGRCWATLRDMQTTDGRMSGVVHGVIRGLLHVQRVHRIDIRDILICWDGGHCSRRLAIYPEYKSGRHSEDPTPEEQLLRQEYRNQLNSLHYGLGKAGYRQLKVDGIEADDLLGIYAEQHIEKGDHVYIYGSDKDFHQLVRPLLSIVDPQTKTNNGLRSEAEILTHWQLPSTSHILLYRTIVGDTSDGIKGIFGVGDKGARRVCKFLTFRKFGELDKILSDASEKKDIEALEKFKQNLDIIGRNLLLMRIPRTWDESGYTESQKVQSMLQHTNHTWEVDDLAYASFLIKWELRNILEQR